MSSRRNLLKVSELLYWAIGAISIVEAVRNWSGDRTRSAVFAGFALLSVVMANLRRSMRKKAERSEASNKDSKSGQ